jgi:DNA-binding NtrC family response regulator
LCALPGWEIELLGVTASGEVRRLLTEDRIDVSFIDHHLGETTRLAVLRSVLDEDVNIPVVALTGQHDPSIADEYTRVGSNDHLEKDELSSESLFRSSRRCCRVE